MDVEKEKIGEWPNIALTPGTDRHAATGRTCPECERERARVQERRREQDGGDMVALRNALSLLEGIRGELLGEMRRQLAGEADGAAGGQLPMGIEWPKHGNGAFVELGPHDAESITFYRDGYDIRYRSGDSKTIRWDGYEGRYRVTY